MRLISSNHFCLKNLHIFKILVNSPCSALVLSEPLPERSFQKKNIDRSFLLIHSQKNRGVSLSSFTSNSKLILISSHRRILSYRRLKSHLLIKRNKLQ